ncbi:hypothetical protein KVP09_15485 [Alcaligenaceae bacterium CGII-47]|nr:hypothetical protein [Alcaligenaceae bacterium CGII-47]
MNFMLRYLTPLILVSFLTACSTINSNEGVMKAETRKGGFMGLATKDNIEVEQAREFAGVNKVVIGGFKVGFNDSKKLQQKKSGMFQSSSSQTGLVKLDGVDQTTRQQITDDMYDNFVQTLTTSGYQVVSRDELTGSPLYKEVKEVDFPYEDDDSGMFSSYGVGYFYSPSQIGPKQPLFFGELKNPGMFGGFSGMGIMNIAGKFTEASGARIIYVSYIVDFAGATSGDFFSAPLQIGQVMAVNSAILGIGKGGTGVQLAATGQLKLGQPVASEIEFAKIQDNTNELEAGAVMAVNVATGFLSGGLAGALRSSGNQTKEYVFIADQTKYADAARDALTKTNALLTEKLVQLR